MASIDVSHLAHEISNMLSTYSKEVAEKIDISSERIAKAAVKKLKASSPKDSGNYAKSWRLDSEGAYGQTKNRIIYVKEPHYRLAHLIEHGHARAGGGRTQGKPHIRPVEQEVMKEFMEEVEEAIKNG